MNKSIILVFFFVLGSLVSLAQNQSATLAVGEVSVRNLKPGDEVKVPITLKTKSGGLFAAFQLFISFDHSLLEWKGTWQNPLTGVINIHENTPFDEASWVINDNGNQFVAVWDDPNFNGADLKNGDLFFDIVFIYKGGLAEGSKSIMVWGDTYEDINGKLVRGKTEIYDENLKEFDLTTINGGLKY